MERQCSQPFFNARVDDDPPGSDHVYESMPSVGVGGCVLFRV
jgi:hypothetical protein